MKTKPRKTAPAKPAPKRNGNGAALSALGTEVENVNAKITELRNSPGAKTTEDQALLVGLTAAGTVLAEKYQALHA